MMSTDKDLKCKSIFFLKRGKIESLILEKQSQFSMEGNQTATSGNAIKSASTKSSISINGNADLTPWPSVMPWGAIPFMT